MKQYKKNIILIALIIVLSLYVVLHKKDRTNYKLPDIPDISEKNITKLEIAAITSSIILKKKQVTGILIRKIILQTIIKLTECLALSRISK
ncbi:MAG: hypothetical protein J7K84_10985 [Deltaproteobacteria bacterium]|nr:hypothetical protein [Deltaproteobacteria bacterium]